MTGTVRVVAWRVLQGVAAAVNRKLSTESGPTARQSTRQVKRPRCWLPLVPCESVAPRSTGLNPWPLISSRTGSSSGSVPVRSKLSKSPTRTRSGKAGPAVVVRSGGELGGGTAMKATRTVSRLGRLQPSSPTTTSSRNTRPWLLRHSGKQRVAVSVSGAPGVRTAPLVAVVKLGSSPEKLTGLMVSESRELGSGSVKRRRTQRLLPGKKRRVSRPGR